MFYVYIYIYYVYDIYIYDIFIHIYIHYTCTKGLLDVDFEAQQLEDEGYHQPGWRLCLFRAW